MKKLCLMILIFLSAKGAMATPSTVLSNLEKITINSFLSQSGILHLMYKSATFNTDRGEIKIECEGNEIPVLGSELIKVYLNNKELAVRGRSYRECKSNLNALISSLKNSQACTMTLSDPSGPLYIGIDISCP